MRKVRITVDVVDNEITYLASAPIDPARPLGQQIYGRGANEQLAINALKAELKRRADVEKAREGYPKTIEVDW